MRVLKFLKWGLGLPVIYLAIIAFGIIVIVVGGAMYLTLSCWGRWQRRRARAKLQAALQAQADAKYAAEIARRRVGVIRHRPWRDPRDQQRSFNEHLRDQARGRYH